jgi:hypothetical protein
MSAGEGMWRDESHGDVAQPWLVAKGLVASILFALGLAAFLLVRRATGALEAPLPPLLLIATAAALFAWVSSVRIACQWRTDRGAIVASPFERMVATWLPLVTLTMVAVACSYPGRRVVDWLVWAPVILANSIGPEVWLRLRRASKNPARRSSTAVAVDDDPPSAESGTLLQQLSRSRDADGQESVHGTLVAEFAPGERTSTLHIAFCPPFELLPQVEAEIAEGPDASVRVAQVLHNGARLEVRLAQPAAESATVGLEFAARDSAE